MNINYKQAQLELFPGESKMVLDANKPRYLFANLTLSFENLVVVSMLALLALLFSFSLGVERGKTIVNLNTQEIISVEKKMPKVQKNVTDKRRIEPSMTVPLATTASIESKGAPVHYRLETTSTIPTSVVSSNPQDLAVAVQKNLMNTPKPVLSAKEEYTVQIASYKTEGVALRANSSLQKKGWTGFVMQKGDYFILCAGKFSDKNEAQKALGQLKKQYNDSLVRRL